MSEKKGSLGKLAELLEEIPEAGDGVTQDIAEINKIKERDEQEITYREVLALIRRYGELADSKIKFFNENQEEEITDSKTSDDLKKWNDWSKKLDNELVSIERDMRGGSEVRNRNV